MSSRISQGCTLVLLLAMSIALAVGLMAWGPINMQPADHAFADQRGWAAIPHAVNVLSCLPLLLTALWGVYAAWRSEWPSDLRRVWMGFFTLVALHAGSSLIYHLNPHDAAFALANVFAAGAFSLLLLGFLAERLSLACPAANLAVVALALTVLAGLWWLAGYRSGGHGDLRALLFLQCVPILLIPAGAVSLAGRYTSSGDWLAMLYLYVAARAAGMADSIVFDATGFISGHTLMHLLLAAVAARLAYRASTARDPARRLGRGATAEAAAHPEASLTSVG